MSTSDWTPKTNTLNCLGDKTNSVKLNLEIVKVENKLFCFLRGYPETSLILERRCKVHCDPRYEWRLRDFVRILKEVEERSVRQDKDLCVTHRVERR